MFSTNLFQQQTVLITGGATGIGLAMAEQFLRHGAYVFIASRKEEKLRRAAEQLQQLGPCSYKVCDIRDLQQVQALAEYISETAGRLDILVNNAGGQFPSLAEDLSVNGWNAVINNNLNGNWYMMQTMFNKFFKPQQRGCIINIIVNIFRGFPGMAHTGAARAGIDNLTKSLAVEWSKYNIRVNAIAPGIIQSSGLENYPPELLQGIADTIPMKRLGSTQEVAYLSMFLASPMAGYITGETIYIDGGQRLWGQIFQL
jgi:citronellol/citronellal dehydrogenase